jgi:hypothetical protein
MSETVWKYVQEKRKRYGDSGLTETYTFGLSGESGLYDIYGRM